MREATREEEALVNRIINDLIEEEPCRNTYQAEYMQVRSDDPGHLAVTIDINGCPGSDSELFPKFQSLRSATLNPNGESSSVYCDAMVIEITAEDGKVIIIDGTLDAPPANDEGHTGHFMGTMRICDAAHADEARERALRDHDTQIAGETVSDLTMLVTRLESIDERMLEVRHAELCHLTDKLNRLLARAG